jgi:hypothetical protein
MNGVVTQMIPASLAISEPWYNLTDTEKVQTFLACPPLDTMTWAFTKDEEIDWFDQLEPTLFLTGNTLSPGHWHHLQKEP